MTWALRWWRGSRRRRRRRAGGPNSAGTAGSSSARRAWPCCSLSGRRSPSRSGHRVAEKRSMTVRQSWSRSHGRSRRRRNQRSHSGGVERGGTSLARSARYRRRPSGGARRPSIAPPSPASFFASTPPQLSLCDPSDSPSRPQTDSPTCATGRQLAGYIAAAVGWWRDGAAGPVGLAEPGFHYVLPALLDSLEDGPGAEARAAAQEEAGQEQGPEPVVRSRPSHRWWRTLGLRGRLAAACSATQCARQQSTNQLHQPTDGVLVHTAVHTAVQGTVACCTAGDAVEVAELGRRFGDRPAAVSAALDPERWEPGPAAVGHG